MYGRFDQFRYSLFNLIQPLPMGSTVNDAAYNIRPISHSMFYKRQRQFITKKWMVIRLSHFRHSCYPFIYGKIYGMTYKQQSISREFNRKILRRLRKNKKYFLSKFQDECTYVCVHTVKEEMCSNQNIYLFESKSVEFAFVYSTLWRSFM